MKIMIAGGSGFVGRHLAEFLKRFDCHLTLISRRPNSTVEHYDEIITWQQLGAYTSSDYDAVINLAGFSISARRWSNAVKAEIASSRINSTHALIEFMARNAMHQSLLINASAVGFYAFSDERQDEDNYIDNRDNHSFLHQVAYEWEQAALSALSHNIPLTITRFGVVLGRDGGMLQKLLPSFKRGFGSVISGGRQCISWIHVDDLCRALFFILKNHSRLELYNLCSPYAVTQKQFAGTLAGALHKSLFLPLPAFMVKMMFGRMGQELLLSGQNIYPARLLKEKFTFDFADIKVALDHLCAKG
ncbi:MAG: TIGR01777 family oxidoreductase [Francisellaceae bacterium]